MNERLAILDKLEGMSAPDLRNLWRTEFQEEPPGTSSRDFLRLEIAWRLQASVYGDLSASTRRRLRDVLATDKDASPPSPAAKLRPGTSLVREWNGVKHTVTVVEGGFLYRGKVYTTLSAVAKHITGTQWSGPVFFGLKKPAGAGQKS